ncbi:MAG: PGF-CTERM sorting domain-containing protein [Methanoregula sp.]|uniref:PGF-CTERM sorting domain-containing protein n=1 Tax=Methanoregula sp. TaxID=2052170 RepID=UPI0025FD28F9|nr:PGF-CTERM sorting domain-containing protein [Methanoregula sp.]MCK9630913.1 PGF-CTERM sorting domain-containing protein [Methanoregula sp.]
MTERLTLALVAIALFTLLAVMPVLAESNLTDEQIAAIMAARPYIMVMTAGDQNYDVGETIEFFGNNTISDMTYLFITGPGLPEDGAQINNPDPAHSPLENDNPASYQQVSVKSDHTWSWKWDTTNYVLESGIYRIHAVPRLYDKDQITPTGTALITIKKSAGSATSTTATPTLSGNEKTVLPGAVTIIAAGNQNYNLGDEIEFKGTNTGTWKTYLFIVGPNLKSAGSQIQRADPGNYAVQNNDTTSFKSIDVNGDHTWSWKWGTAHYALDAGTYTIYAVSQPYDKENLANAAYGTVSITIGKPLESATTSPSTAIPTTTTIVTITTIATPNPSAPITAPTKSPGFGTLVALIGLGAVAFIAIRRH